ncbi:MAG: hypothetical protein KDB53_20130, partial [Planctomycetes bacterium]|nr:hypothetical protein [Planctomycetota bacterium]
MEVLGHRLTRAMLAIGLSLLGRWRYRRGLKRGDLGPAETAFRRLADIDGASFTAHYHLGLILAHDGRRLEALRELAIAAR